MCGSLKLMEFCNPAGKLLLIMVLIYYELTISFDHGKGFI